MKTAIYVEDGIVQLVLTPKSKFEKDALKPFMGEDLTVKTFVGSFYDCRGGWIRQEEFNYGEQNDRSIMIRINEKKEETKPDSKSKFIVKDISDVTLPDAFGDWPECVNIENVDEKTVMTYLMNPTEKLLIIKKGD